MSAFDDVSGTRVRMSLVGKGSLEVRFPRAVTFEQLLAALQRQFGEARDIGGPRLPARP